MVNLLLSIISWREMRTTINSKLSWCFMVKQKKRMESKCIQGKQISRSVGKNVSGVTETSKTASTSKSEELGKAASISRTEDKSVGHKVLFNIKEGRCMVASAVARRGSTPAEASNAQKRKRSTPAEASNVQKCKKSMPAQASGDAACTFSLPDGRMAFILSDGMGTGMKAASESQTVVRRLKSLLKKGETPSRAIKLVNKELIKNGNTDIFATVDLLIIDKETGYAQIYKMGAVTSFIIREGQVEKIEKASLPIGIIGKISACQLKIKLRLGDTIVMVSDGITEADRSDLEAGWLRDYLMATPSTIGPRVMANEVVRLAQQKYKKRQTDDLTAVVIRIV